MSDPEYTEQIEQDIESVESEIRRMSRMPLRYTIHGQTIDNTDRLAELRSRLRHLRAKLGGRSIFEGPDLEV